MTKKFLISAIILVLGLTFFNQCIYESKSVVPKSDSTNNNSNSGKGITPTSTIPGNRVFLTTFGNLLIPGVYNENIPSVRGRCDCDTITTCKYYTVTGYFEKDTITLKAKASFNVFFNKKPTSTRNYQIVPFISDTTNKAVYALTDTSVYLTLTEIVKTGKTWTGSKGYINVSVQNGIPKVVFRSIRAQNISNSSDTLIVSGDIGCK